MNRLGLPSRVVEVAHEAAGGDLDRAREILRVAHTVLVGSPSWAPEQRAAQLQRFLDRCPGLFEALRALPVGPQREKCGIDLVRLAAAEVSP